MRRNWGACWQERLMCQRQSEEMLKQKEAKRVNMERRLQAIVRDEEGTERRRQVRQVREEREERQMESALLKVEEDRIHREEQIEQEEKMSKELARIKYEKEREEKMRQHIKDNSMELRELESKLKSAYLNKGRAAQLAEQEAKRFETRCEEADYARKLEKERERVAVEQLRLEQIHHEEQLQYQRQLEQQFVVRERRRQEAYEEFLKEKLLVDEIIRNIYEEDQMERQLKLEKVQATKQHIEEFKRQQAEWRRMEQEKVEAENRRIVEFANYQQGMEENRMAKMQEMEEVKDKLLKKLSKMIDDERHQREEKKRVRDELFLEEKEEANRQREIEEMEEKIRQRLLMQQSFQEQMAYKEMQRKAEKEEDEAFRRIMMAKFAEDDRIEQLNAQKRRMKQLKHKREVENLIEDRRRQREANVELEAKARAAEQEREALSRQIIEEERQKLLKRHATKLLGYMPKGMLREDDLEHFDEDFRKNFIARPADVSSEDN